MKIFKALSIILQYFKHRKILYNIGNTDWSSTDNPSKHIQNKDGI